MLWESSLNDYFRTLSDSSSDALRDWNIWSFFKSKNVIILLMSIELILLSVNINLVAFSSYMNDLVGQVFTLFVLTVAAAEAAIGLAILVSFFRIRGTIAVEDVNVMKG